MYSRIYLLFVSTLVFAWLSSCEEKDVLYGESMDDYTLTGTAQDDAARTYFAQKDIACIDAKADFPHIIPRGYQHIDLILKDPEGNLQTVPTRGTYGKLTTRYESADGGWASVSVVTTIGYARDFVLDGCNERDAYFYVVVYSADGSVLEDVAAYSVNSRDLPLAYELAFETHIGYSNDLSHHTVAGIAIRRGGNRSTSVRTTIGDQGYLAYLLRSGGYFSIATPAGYAYRDPKFAIREGYVLGFTQNFQINGYDIREATFDGSESSRPTLVHLFNFAINRTSHPLARFGRGNTSPSYDQVRAKINVIRRGRLLYSFYDYATLNLPNFNGAVNLELL